MSRPKVHYSPPPMYSRQVFDGRLHRVLEAAADLRAVVAELSAIEVRDFRGNVVARGTDLAQREAKRIEAATAPFACELPAQFGDADRTRVERSLDGQIETAKLTRAPLEAGIRELRALAEDHAAHGRVNAMIERTADELRRYRAAVVSQLEEAADTGDAPEVHASAQAIGSVELGVKPPKFVTGYRQREATALSAIDVAVRAAESQIVAASQALDARLVARHASDRRVVADPEAPARATAEAGARAAVAACSDDSTRASLLKEIDCLIRSDIQRSPWFLDQVAVKAREAESAVAARARVRDLLARLPGSDEVHPRVREDLGAVVQAGHDLLGAGKVDKRLLEDIEARAKRLDRLTREARKEDDIAAAEQAFVRRELVRGLEKRGYLVEASATVIDFGTARDVVLTQSGGGGVVKLTFDGKEMRYAWFAAESADGTEATRAAKDLQRRSCELYKEVVGDLQKLGVPMKSAFVGPTGEFVTVVPEKVKERVRQADTVSGGRQKRAAKKKEASRE